MWEEVKMNLYYISFASETKFLGATVVEGISETNALEIATNNALNPGGQAAIIYIPEELHNEPDVAPLKYKLFSKEQMEALGAKRHGDLSNELKIALEYHAVAIGD